MLLLTLLILIYEYIIKYLFETLISNFNHYSMIIMPTTIQKKEPNPLHLRNKINHGDICTTIVSISMPLSLKLKLDSICGEQQRSGYVVKILKQHFAKIDEKDPRWLLKQEKEKFETWKIVKQTEEANLDGEKLRWQIQKKVEEETFIKRIRVLEQEAEQKKKELLEH